MTERGEKRQGHRSFNEHAVKKAYGSNVDKRQKEESLKASAQKKSEQFLERAVREKLKEIFKALDSDRDGKISADKIDINSKFIVSQP